MVRRGHIRWGEAVYISALALVCSACGKTRTDAAPDLDGASGTDATGAGGSGIKDSGGEAAESGAGGSGAPWVAPTTAYISISDNFLSSVAM